MEFQSSPKNSTKNAVFVFGSSPWRCFWAVSPLFSSSFLCVLSFPRLTSRRRSSAEDGEQQRGVGALQEKRGGDMVSAGHARWFRVVSGGHGLSWGGARNISRHRNRRPWTGYDESWSTSVFQGGVCLKIVFAIVLRERGCAVDVQEKRKRGDRRVRDGRTATMICFIL